MVKKKKVVKRKPASKKGSRTRKRASSLWKPGQSGNPKGRKPDKELRTIRDLARWTSDGKDDALKTIKALRNVRDTAISPQARVAACKELLDRMFGKSKEHHEITGKDGQMIQTQCIIMGDRKVKF